MKPYLVTLFLAIPFFLLAQSLDWRLITNGRKIYEHGYCDQPYIVTTEDGTWVCTFTTSPGKEGDQIQYIACTSSKDQGRTWSVPVEIEPAASGIEASWAIPLLTSFGRIFVFYTYNGDTIRQLPSGLPIRADTHGWYCYRYSDDKGATWSQRFRLDMKLTACDRTNDFSGSVQMFWGIGKPVVKDGTMWFSFTKLGKYFLEQGEGWLYTSDNILTEKDISKIRWQLLPKGDLGIRNSDLGSVQEEFNIQPLNVQGGIYCVYRTTMGQPAESYSFDGGQSWTQPQLINYQTGCPLRNPRACPRLWKCKNGKYLLWYHNNGSNGFSNRNPAWVAGGIELDGKIQWSQPEIFIYGPDHSYESGRFSYPDLIEENGRYWVSTTQKTAATVHEIPADFIKNLWGQFEHRSISKDGLIGEYENFTEPIVLRQSLTLENGGFALDFWIEFDDFRNALIFRGGDEQTKIIDLFVTDSATLEFRMSEGEHHISLVSDHGRLQKGKKHHVAILADADAMITYMLIDGSICDGGGRDTFGFKWFSPSFSAISFSKIFMTKFFGTIHKLRWYNQRKSTSQMVNNYHAEIP